MKKILFLLFLILAFSLSQNAAINWKGVNHSVTSNTNISAPFVRSGLWIGNYSANTVKVVITKNGYTSTADVLTNASIDFFPLAWNVNLSDSVTLNVSATSNVHSIWYEINY